MVIVPLPSLRITRATAALRRPTALTVSMLQLFQFVNVDDFGILCLVGMVGAVVDVHVLDDAASETVFGKHTFHHTDKEGVHAGFDVLVERFFHEHFGSELALTAGITGEVEIDFVSHLFACEDNFVGVDDDDVVAALKVGSVVGFVFAAEKFGDFRAQTAEMLALSVDDNPLVFDLLCVRGGGFVA